MKICMDCPVEIFGLNKRCAACKAERQKTQASQWKKENIEASRLHGKKWSQKNSGYLVVKRLKNKEQKRAQDKTRRDVKRGCPPRVPMTREQKTEKQRIRDSLKNKNRERENSRLRRWREKNPLSDGTVASRIGLSIKKCPAEIIELKREQIIVKRLSRQLKQATKPTGETQ